MHRFRRHAVQDGHRQWLTDPSSGAILGIVEEKRGDIEVVNVQEKFSVAVMKTPFQAARGDLVKLTGDAR